ncbi:MAG: hypothetical protein IKV86_05855 [Clostridia bacterium]|nr:hypothetical protein [Clostridia bacterium]
MSDIKMKRKKKDKNKKILFLAIILIVAALFLTFNILSGRTETDAGVETVMKGTAEEKVTTSGYILRDESVIKAPESGMVSFRADNGERVSKGSPVAVIYSGDVSDEVKNELSSIYQRISELEGSVVEKDLQAGDVVGSDTQVKKNIELISNAVYSGDVSSVIQYKDDIIRIIRVNSPEGEQIKTTLEKLQERKAELEGSISGKTTYIYADMAGVICSQLDGAEDFFDISNIDNITVDYLRSCPQVVPYGPDEVKKDSPCLKIVSNYEWYYATEVDEVWIEGVKVGHTVKLRFTDISDETVEGTVYSISQPSNGKVALVIKSRNMFNGMYTTRSINAEVIKKTYEGFKVSKDAVHIDEDGKYYVYINREGVNKRRDVTILYADDAYVIIKEDNAATNNILLYDEVVVSGKGGEAK